MSSETEKNNPDPRPTIVLHGPSRSTLLWSLRSLKTLESLKSLRSGMGQTSLFKLLSTNYGSRICFRIVWMAGKYNNDLGLFAPSHHDHPHTQHGWHRTAYFPDDGNWWRMFHDAGVIARTGCALGTFHHQPHHHDLLHHHLQHQDLQRLFQEIAFA